MRLSDIKGIGKKREEVLGLMGIKSAYDLANYLPYRYEDRSKKTPIKDSIDGFKHYYELKLLRSVKTVFYGARRTITRTKATDGEDEINLIWYNDRFSPSRLEVDQVYKFYGLFDSGKKALINPIISKLNEDLIGGIYPIYSVKRGISQKELIRFKDNLFEMGYFQEEYLPEYTKRDFNITQDLKSLHRPESYIDLLRAKNNLIIRDLFLERLANIFYRESLDKSYVEFSPVSLDDVIKILPFSLSPSQVNALEEISKDMTSKKRMNRLVIGDVGSGKTIVGILSAMIALKNGYQVAFMAPTELLAIQHYENYKDLIKKLGYRPEILTGSKKTSEKKSINAQLASSEIDIIFGTHALFQERVEFSKLGLVILDEQQRFGVFQRKKLVDKGDYPDILLMTATPIPRTMALSLYDQLDLSFIDSRMDMRKKIDSYVLGINKEKRVIDFAIKQVLEGRQVYIIASRVEEDTDLESVENLYRRLKKYIGKKANIDYLHGKMEADSKASKQAKFVEGKTDILIATSIVEVGIDVKNANLMIIYDADRFGLSQLHQLRGRVGRGQAQSYCIFLTRSSNDISEKLAFIGENDDGFKIAEKDLELRGAGQVFGLDQSGFSNNFIDLLANQKNIEIVSELIDKLDVNKLSPSLKSLLDMKLLDYQKIIMN